MQTRFTPELLARPGMADVETQVRRCVHCGFCNSTCPTYGLLGDELDGPRGRIYLMKEMLEGDRDPTPEVVKHIDRCLSCLACVTTCPSGVDYAHLVDHARAYIEARYRRPWPDRMARALLAAVLPYPTMFRAAVRAAGWAKGLEPLLRKVPALKPMAAMLALAPARLPRRAPPPAAASASSERPQVLMLGGCAEPVLSPQTQAAAARLLHRVGLDVVYAPGQACCGALTLHLGKTDPALAAARRNIDAWTPLIEGGRVRAILATASGCGSQLKDYGRLLREDPAYAARAAAVSAVARDLTEILAETGLPQVTNPTGLTVAYHGACSLQHGQQVRAQPLALLEAAGFIVRQPAGAHLCCGSAGTYNILQSDIAAQLRDNKAAALQALDAHLICAGNIGCITQIAAAAALPVVHVAELLDWATGGPRPAEV